MIIHTIQRSNSLPFLWEYINSKGYSVNTTVTLSYTKLTEQLPKMFFVNNASSTDATSEFRKFFRSPTDGVQDYFNKVAETGDDPNHVTGNIFLQAAPEPKDYSQKDIRKFVFSGRGVFIEQALALDIIDISDIDYESGIAYVLPEKVMFLLLLRICAWSDTVCTRNDHLFQFLWLAYHSFNSIVPETLARDNKQPEEHTQLLNQRFFNWSDQHQEYNEDVDLYREGVGTTTEKSSRNNINDNQPSVGDNKDGKPTDQEGLLTIAAKPKVGSQKNKKKKKIKSIKKAAKDKRKLEALSTVGRKKKQKRPTPKPTPQIDQLALLQQ